MSEPVWQKLGLVFPSPADRPWRQTHASTPTAEILSDDLVRVYFTSRDADNRSHISSLELNLRSRVVENLSPVPHVAPGAAGAFDDSGAAMGCLVVAGTERWLYYVGWSLADKTVPWRNTIGLAVSKGHDLQFEKRDGPVLGLNDIDPFSVSYPWILRDGPVWRMWYGSNLAWGRTPETMQHVIKYAESRDGLRWKRSASVAIPLEATTKDIAIARPCVIKERDRYCMWYSRRAAEYRIGYAESRDGMSWTRLDGNSGIEPSVGSWDGKTIEYPCVFDAGAERYMLYNGDDYGRAGFGLAVRVA